MLTFVFVAGLIIGGLFLLYGLVVAIGFVIMIVAARFGSKSDKTQDDLREEKALPGQWRRFFHRRAEDTPP